MIYFNSPYEVVVTESPTEFPYRCYGVLNKDTDVVEAYIGSLAKARAVADQYAGELKHGIKDPIEELADAVIRGMGKEDTGGGVLQ